MTKSNGTFKQGDRVVDRTGFFGAGVFEQYDFFLDYALVTWDRRPAREYNMGENPCMVHPSQLERERNGQADSMDAGARI